MLTRIFHRILRSWFRLLGNPIEAIVSNELISNAQDEHHFTIFLPNHKRFLDGIYFAYALLENRLKPYPNFLAHYKFSSTLEGKVLRRLGGYMPSFQSNWLQANPQELERTHSDLEKLVRSGASLVLFLESQLSYSGKLNLPHIPFFRKVLQICAKKGFQVRLVPVSLTYDNIPEATIVDKIQRAKHTFKTCAKLFWNKVRFWQNLRSNHHFKIIFSAPHNVAFEPLTPTAISRRMVQTLSLQALQTVQYLHPATLNNLEVLAHWLLYGAECPHRTQSQMSRILVALGLQAGLDQLRSSVNFFQQTLSLRQPIFKNLTIEERKAFVIECLKSRLQFPTEYQIFYQVRSFLPSLLAIALGNALHRYPGVQDHFCKHQQASDKFLKWLEATFFLSPLLMAPPAKAIFETLPHHQTCFNDTLQQIQERLLLPLLTLIGRLCFTRECLLEESLYEFELKDSYVNKSGKEKIFDPWKKLLRKHILNTEKTSVPFIRKFCLILKKMIDHHQKQLIGRKTSTLVPKSLHESSNKLSHSPSNSLLGFEVSSVMVDMVDSCLPRCSRSHTPSFVE